MNYFYSILLLFTIGALGSLFLGKKDQAANLWGNLFAIAGSVAGLIFSIQTLLSGTTPILTVPSAFPLLSFTFKFDQLSTYFMLIICTIATLASIYALGYVKHYYKKYNIGVLGFFYNIFIASMILVATSHNALFFLIVWELMSLASYFLVIYENREHNNIKAGSLYFMMTHVGTAFIVLAFLLMYSVTGSFEFEAIKTGIVHAPSQITNLILLFALFGFGTKAGIIPLHIWLPSAHPAAPTHVSALMSGVMIKTGIYMLIRFSLFFLPAVPLWWGLLILILGAVSSLLGVLYALAEHDIKKLLAYHSIENIGIILLGLGSAFVFVSAHLYSLAAIGLIAALYHTLNHATFKALLFMGAGSVISETHTRNIEEYGGLIKHMPQTALFFLIGSMAISALPPFNGFFSEWMTFQSLFQGVLRFDVLTKLTFILSAGALAFTGGLAAACFVKAFGATFLARPRNQEVAHTKEPGVPLRAGMAGLAALTIVLGFFSGTVTGFLNKVAASLINLSGTETMIHAQTQSVNIANNFAFISMPQIFIGLVAALTVVAGITYLLTRTQKVSRNITWDCGSDLSPRMEITATGFSRSFITVFQKVLKPLKETEVEYDDERMKYFPKSNAIHLELQDIYMPYIYQPLRKLVLDTAGQMKKIQVGYTNAYILYILIALIGILFVLAL